MEKEEEKYWECGGVGDGSGGDGGGKVNKSSMKGKELIVEEQEGEKGSSPSLSLICTMCTP